MKYKLHSTLLLPLVIILIGSPLKGGYSGVAVSRKVEVIETPGLYNASDKVVTLNIDNMKLFVINRKYATLMQFYNSFCGHCQKLAPIYKRLADDLYAWRKLIKVAALDCSDFQNTGICRDFEVTAYPTIRYFSPYYANDPTKLGDDVRTQNPEEIKQILLNKVMNASITDSYWPNFSDLTDTSTKNLFANVNDEIKYILVIHENVNSTLVSNLILDFSLYHSMQIRRATNPDIAISFNILEPTTIAVVDRAQNTETIHSHNLTKDSFKEAIDNFLISKKLHVHTSTEKPSVSPRTVLLEERNRSEIIERVHADGVHTIYKIDLDHALYYTLFHEILKVDNINGERLLALQRFVGIVKRLNPLGKNGEEFLEQLDNYVLDHNQSINGTELEVYVNDVKKRNMHPIFADTSSWIGCIGSQNHLRGYTCGMWKLFHYLTVKAAADHTTQKPLEVLQAIHGYVKYFFGCSECSRHFQKMAFNRKMWDVKRKDEAVLWLWSAHNEVNQRLSGEVNEDPKFPKHQFPSSDSCAKCYGKNQLKRAVVGSATPKSQQIDWNNDEVLHFMKQIYDEKNISHYGIKMDFLDDSKRLAHIMGNVFSNIDISFGFILYGFCIVMMIFAVKLFMFRGYRRKPYPHNLLGKV